MSTNISLQCAPWRLSLLSMLGGWDSISFVRVWFPLLNVTRVWIRSSAICELSLSWIFTLVLSSFSPGTPFFSLSSKIHVNRLSHFVDKLLLKSCIFYFILFSWYGQLGKFRNYICSFALIQIYFNDSVLVFKTFDQHTFWTWTCLHISSIKEWFV